MRPDHRDTGSMSEPLVPDSAPDSSPDPGLESGLDPGSGPAPRQAAVLAVVAAGGVLGACARYGATLIWPATPGAFPWTTFGINVSGCALMGVLMVLITERFTVHPLVRPLLGTGVLGGYTTFSTYAVDAQHLVDTGHPGIALFYLVATLSAALLAVWGAAALTRYVVAVARVVPPSPEAGAWTG
ncbi:fluoride efflux transporter FluC [Actinoplanes derwentensis]|uniref:Fluoride-specific ion channel FluC n=1 Tax=Actinoplanes derwentensis TaxID=113562 RepID=A0A1H1W7V2_9ACTN|nr:CrcB family protein [Actinoplanes derwentensis]GID84062.1 hypothetical protein Ade03nite_29860 [Actinoplanes derwentensis]SDS92526.1 CrcB protein [Actinoplanes derwentensis]